MFKNKTLMITGGTGSFGNAVLRRFIESDIGEVRILSRDEKKQDDLRKKYRSDKLKCYIGDVRDRDSLINAMRGVDYLFHAAALKQVPSCEFYPLEAVKTNVMGTENVIQTAIQVGVKKVVCLSTDKAVYPINAMGISKAMMEKVIVATARSAPKGTMICATRYGNVMASRGSVIPLFVKQVQSGEALTVTDRDMTRFMMTLDDAVDLVAFAFNNGENGDIFVQKAPAATIQVLIDALLSLLKKEGHPIVDIGTRHGEKVFETLCSREEMAVAQDLGEYFRIPSDNRGLDYDRYFSKGSLERNIVEYNSHNTSRLDVDGMTQLLLKLDYISETLVMGKSEPHE